MNPLHVSPSTPWRTSQCTSCSDILENLLLLKTIAPGGTNFELTWPDDLASCFRFRLILHRYQRSHTLLFFVCSSTPPGWPTNSPRSRVNMAQAHRTLGLYSSGTAHQSSISRCLTLPDLEREPSRWPLQTVDDNAAASRCFTGPQARPKVSHESEQFRQHSVVDRNFHSAYHAPFRPRRDLDDLSFSRDPTSRSFEEDQLAHERRIRSYRDTTSEIISLYASRNTMAQNTTLVRHGDDASIQSIL